MLQLQLLRHAKSSWTTGVQEDYERPLNRRGISDASALGVYLNETDDAPHLILMSSATRTCETWLHLTAQLPTPPEIMSLETLYGSTVTTLIREINTYGGAAQNLMVIAHNPGIESLVPFLSHADPTFALPRIQLKYPTSGLSTLTFDIENWADMKPDTGTLISFSSPKSRNEA